MPVRTDAPREPDLTALLDATSETPLVRATTAPASTSAFASPADPPADPAADAAHLTQALSIGSSGSTIALSLGSARALMPGTPEAAELAAAVEEDRRAAAVGPRRRRRVAAWIVSVVLLLAAVGAGLSWWSTVGPGAYTAVPTGLAQATLDDATAALGAAGLAVEPVEAFSDDLPAGSVMAVDPGEGAKIRRDGTVTVTVSQGIEHFTVPAGLTGISVADSEAALKKAGFTQVSVTSDWNTTIPADTVMSVSVVEGTSLPHSAPIVLAVSKGPEPVTVPQVLLLNLEDATGRLDPLDLTVTTTEEYSETVPEGRVVSQSLDSGSQAHRGDQVTLVISLGKPFVEVPDVLLKPVAEAEQILEDLGFKVKVKYYMGIFGNEVRSQSEAPGTSLRMGSEITLNL